MTAVTAKRSMNEANRLRELALKLSTLVPNEHTTGIIGYLIGATYSLQHAAGHRRRVPVDATPTHAYVRQLRQTARLVSQGREPRSPWLRGMHFNSALHRVAACYERVPRVHSGDRAPDRAKYWRNLCGARVALLQRVAAEANELKHEGTGKTRQQTQRTKRSPLKRVSYSEALAALAIVVEHVVTVKDWKGDW